MGAELERSLFLWKRVAVVTIVVAVGLLAALTGVALLLLHERSARLPDPRLIGTWQSDADRTLADIREYRALDGKQEVAFRKVYGKMRVTYHSTTIESELNGSTEVSRYDVLGKDTHSVVIREIASKPSPLDGIVDVSEFTVIQFDGSDSYWLTTKIGGGREYFKRIR